MATFVVLAVLLLAVAVSLLGVIFSPRDTRPRGSARWADPVYVRDEDVLTWGDPRAVVVGGLPDGRGGVYSAPLRPEAAGRYSPFAGRVPA